jgi:hypothetical protein
MTSQGIEIERKVRDGSWGLRIGVVLAVVALLIALFALRGGEASDESAATHQEATLTHALLDTYLKTSREVRLGRQEARAAGWKPATWSEYPRIAEALKQAGWVTSDYLRVEGQVSAARLELTEPGSVHDLDDPNSRPVPPGHLEVVRPRLAEVVSAQGSLGP